MKKPSTLQLCGAREHNLNISDLTLNHDRFIAITGVSGSGKSSLAFNTIYAEGGRRYIQTFDAYTRQFLERMPKPEIDSIQGIRPALALEQANRTVNTRSTVGTLTEINDYIKILWSELSEPLCSNCNIPIKRQTPAEVIEQTLEEARQKQADLFLLNFDTRLKGTSSISSLVATLLTEGFTKYFDEDSAAILPLEDLASHSPTTGLSKLSIILERVLINSLTESRKLEVQQSIAQGFEFGHGKLSIHLLRIHTNNTTRKFEILKSLKFNRDLTCQNCSQNVSHPRPGMFSFNSPLGACTECGGFGKTLEIDRTLCVPDENLNIAEGALSCWNTPATKREKRELIKFCQNSDIDINTPWKKLSRAKHELIFKGHANFIGVLPWFKSMERMKYKMQVRVFISRYRSQKVCQTCQGNRLKAEALQFKLNERSLPEIWQTSISELSTFFNNIKNTYTVGKTLASALEEVCLRLQYLCEVGLPYLTLDRQTKTLSAGEHQRVGLTNILGARLSDTALVLDEPTIGLHPRDSNRLIKAIRRLRDAGNSLLVVEHDQSVICQADEILELGPKAGNQGGEVVYYGSVRDFTKCKQSLTVKYLTRELRPAALQSKINNPSKKKQQLTITHANANNLKNISVRIPLNNFTVLSGVSGSGKSTLLSECLYRPFLTLAHNSRLSGAAKANTLKGWKNIDDIVFIDQTPVGKTPRSNPATYTKAWNIIRECLAETAHAQSLGMNKSVFSFNTDNGRCLDCKGAGYHKVEMQFLADTFVLCQTCNGRRFQEPVLEVRYHGKSVLDFLRMSIDECLDFLGKITESTKLNQLLHTLKPLQQLGLGYLTLGHPLNKLSGGEAQRIKLASYLRTEPDINSNKHFLFLLDEPSTGLHPHNISDLLNVFRLLINCGHSVICIEHNLDIIANADWLIELGPEGGERGGEVIIQGEPSALLQDKDAIKCSRTLEYLSEHLNPKNKFNEDSRKAQFSETKLPITVTSSDAIELSHIRHHNLNNISVSIPKNQITAITGVSGSGKSSLAFDVLFAEGQRRYIDCLSPYARQFIKQLERPEISSVRSIPPTIAVSQKSALPAGISTIGTVSEAYQFLRLLYAKVGVQHCPEHDVPISSSNVDEICTRLVKKYSGKQVFLFTPMVSGRKGHYRDLFERALNAELTEARVDGRLVKITESLKLDRNTQHWISLLVASLTVSPTTHDMLTEAVKQCMVLGNGSLEISVANKHSAPAILSTERECPICHKGFRPAEPQDFSFSSKRGACLECGGKGQVTLKNKTTKCPSCLGSRLQALGSHIYLEDYKISDLSNLTATALKAKLSSMTFNKRLAPILDPLFAELFSRLDAISLVGLDYLSLNRESNSLSGGEAQRLRLARALGSPLSGVCYILDEPTIGLHPKDRTILTSILRELKKRENTVVVVEHDKDIIRLADHIIDIGPGGGAQGGQLLSSGPFQSLIRHETSPTAKAFRDEEQTFAVKSARAAANYTFFTIKGARSNNLNNLSVNFKHRALNVVCGVSGAGKSSLVHQTLIPALKAKLSKNTAALKNWDELINTTPIQGFTEVRQTPIGKSPASVPASYLGVLTEIRNVYANLPEAVAKGYLPKDFSFNANNSKGRCKHCKGKGKLKIPLGFLPVAETLCEICRGSRYNEDIKSILYKGISISQLLELTLEEAKELFSKHRKIKYILDTTSDIGLGYITLGQPSYTLSGGECQRLKISKHLTSKVSAHTLYVLDEPTVGLHSQDVKRLISVLHKLVVNGATIIVIEHNLDMIRAAEHLVELGPGPGDKGGKLLFSGLPIKLKNSKRKTPTQEVLQ